MSGSERAWRPRGPVLLLVVAAALPLISWCAGNSPEPQGKKGHVSTTAPDDAAFAKIELESFEKTACSPTIPDDAHGLFIAAPKRVVAGPEMRIPVCVALRLDSASAAQAPPHPLESMIAILTDPARNVVVSGALRDQGGVPPVVDDAPPPDVPEDPDAALITGATWTSYFNFDLLAYLDVPRVPGSYRLFLTLGTIQSNAVDITITAPSGASDQP